MECHTVTMKIIKNNWSVRFSGAMYEKLYEWLQNNKDSMEEIHKFSTWQRFLTKLVERMKESGRKKNWIRDI